MKKLTSFLFFTVLLLHISLLAASNIYDVDYDDDNVIISVKGNTLTINNKLPYPIVIDNIKKNGKIIKNYLTVKNCNYIKYQNEVDVDYSGKDMQIFTLNLIIKPGKTKKISLKCKKGDELRVEYYVVNYEFMADNIYLKYKDISGTEKQYKLFPADYIKKQKSLTGIMIYVAEYNMMIDNYEHPEIDVK